MFKDKSGVKSGLPRTKRSNESILRLIWDLYEFTMISIEVHRDVPQYMAIPWLITWVIALTVSTNTVQIHYIAESAIITHKKMPDENVIFVSLNCSICVTINSSQEGYGWFKDVFEQTLKLFGFKLQIRNVLLQPCPISVHCSSLQLQPDLAEVYHSG